MTKANEKKFHYTTGGRRAGSTFATACLLKARPRGKVAVPNLRALDTLVAHGVKPSQIIIPSEFRDTSRFDAMAMGRRAMGVSDTDYVLDWLVNNDQS